MVLLGPLCFRIKGGSGQAKTTLEFEAKLKKYEDDADAKTAKNRAKRLKRKAGRSGPTKKAEEGAKGFEASASEDEGTGEEPRKRRMAINPATLPSTQSKSAAVEAPSIAEAPVAVTDGLRVVDDD